ncbi:MAG: hypothetical protein P4K94_06635 [Terracidiphilus sp.]|nr:hypothetical protein [Terracidiphilus sp.]
MSAAAALVAAAALAGCGSSTYFAGRSLPPSGIANRVMIAIQNPSAYTKGALEIVDAYYDIRSSYDSKTASFSISGFGGGLPVTIQNMPEEQMGAVYGSSDGSFTFVNYATEATSGTAAGLGSLTSSSIFLTRSEQWVFAANQVSHYLTVANQVTDVSYNLGLPDIYRISVNPGGSAVLAFQQNTNYVYYLRQLSSAQSIAYASGSSSWPKAAIDCEPQTGPLWCLFQAQSPDHLDSTGNYYGTPLVFDHPSKAVFSSDGSTAYVLSCGPECSGNNSSVSLLPVAPMIFTQGQQSGLLPTATALSATCGASGTSNGCTISVPNGASNALVSGTTMYVVGQKQMPDGYWGGYLTRLNLSTNTVIASTSSSPNPVSISDGTPGATSRMIQADDNTLWIGMTKCTNGERYNNPATYTSGYGCLTMFNTSTNTVTMLEPYIGDATGIAAVTGLHKIYTAEGGQVYIYSTVNGNSIDNQYVTVTGTAYDVAYIDATTDANNTVY